ncbi:MAG: hypothetical protein HYZ50_13750 [Deltaproteobacteria bacterium]|nr:hypothetical protein [Deltaproteobacteria bacterium]
MAAPFTLLRHTQQRLLLRKRLNAAAFFLSLALLGWVLSWIALRTCTLPLWWSLFPVVTCGGFFGLAVWKTRQEVDAATAAHVLDAASTGKERFLTLATTPSTLSADSLQGVVLQQAEQLTTSFQLERKVPLTLERRVRWFAGTAVASVLLLFFSPFLRSSFLAPFSSKQEPTLTEDHMREELLAKLEETARQLMTPTATPQEQMSGAQLQALSQQLRDPSLSSQEKRQLIEETQKRWNLDIPLPQLLPFDLQLFASTGKEDKSQGNEDKDSQGKQSSSVGTQQNPEQLEPSSSPSEGNDAQQEPQKDGEKKDQSKPQQNGGSLAFKFPQPQSKGKEQSPQEASGSEQTPAQAQVPDKNLPGVDPNRPGDNQQAQAQNQQGTDPNQPGQPGEGQNKQGEEGEAGVGKGKNALKPGEQPGSGFLTQDARFVKVRVPLGQDVPGGEDGRSEHNGRATPKTPYSNAPLKEGTPDQAQAKQPIPLEYRSILTE